MLRRTPIGILLALAWLASGATAQTAQKFSLQISGLGVRLTGQPDERLKFGGGGELQVRWNPSAFSIGVGGQTTVHKLDNGNATITYKGAFLEPRYILTALGDAVALYGSARLMSLSATYQFLGVTRSVDGFAVSGGGGLLIRLGSRVNGDLGVTVGKESYNSNWTHGATVVSRIGFAIGLG
jgi:hypothetical protein